jgi:hypothetical protein
MAYEFPRPSSVPAGIQVDSCGIRAPAVACAHDRAGGISGHGLSELGQGGLRAHAIAIDLVSQVRDVLPRGTAISALEYWEVAWRVA